MTPKEEKAIREAAVAEGEASTAALFRDQERRTTRQRRGCLVLIASPIIIFVGLMWIAVSDARGWERLRPEGVSAAAWERRHDRCLVANIGTTECASMPLSQIKAIASKVEAEEHAKLCAQDVPEVAKREAKDAVKAALKAPASASFGDDIGMTHKDCTWIVSGEVDAQNSFGAVVRNRWRVELRRIGKDLWIPTSTQLR